MGLSVPACQSELRRLGAGGERLTGGRPHGQARCRPMTLLNPFDVAEGVPYGTQIHRTAEAHAGEVAIIFAAEDGTEREVTFDELDQRSDPAGPRARRARPGPWRRRRRLPAQLRPSTSWPASPPGRWAAWSCPCGGTCPSGSGTGSWPPSPRAAHRRRARRPLRGEPFGLHRAAPRGHLRPTAGVCAARVRRGPPRSSSSRTPGSSCPIAGVSVGGRVLRRAPHAPAGPGPRTAVPHQRVHGRPEPDGRRTGSSCSSGSMPAGSSTSSSATG